MEAAMAAWREAEHPRVAHGRRGGQFVRKPGGGVTAAAEPISAERLDGLLEEWFHPDRLEAARVKHPRSGYMVESGEELRVNHPPPGTEGPPTFEVWDHGDPASRPIGFLPRKTGSAPIAYVYRGVSEAEWRQAQQRGYLQSDQRGTIASWEGTNAAVDPRDAVVYLPADGSDSRVVKIKVAPSERWFTINADQYLRTRDRIPVGRVSAVSPVIRKGKDWSLSLPRGSKASLRRSAGRWFS